MANVKIDIAAEFTGNKAFKQAETASQKMERSVAKLGKQLAGVFAASKLYAFGKQSVKAFAADEKAARSLSLALANTGNAFASIEVEKFIADLQRTTGVLDDNLRPSFRTLLTATGNVKKSQDGLALALDIAAGTGKDLGAVSMALAKAYGGQTTALSRLGAGLDKATLASGDMDVITQALTNKFKGQALAAAQGYSGQMDRLSVASANAKEIIGKDLLDAMSMIAGKDGIGGATSAMEGFATEIGNAIYGIGVLTSKLNALPGAGAITDFLSAPTGLLQLFSLFGKSQKAATGQASPGGAGGIVARIKYQKELDRLAREKIKTDKIDNANTLRKLVLTGDQLALQELEKKFDVERIGLFSAMNQATDGETKMRLLSLIAIKDQNAALAGQIQKANQATDALEAFRQAILASIRALLDKIAIEQQKLMAILGISSAQVASSATFASNDPTAVSGGIPGTAVSMGFGAGTFRQAEAATTNIQVNVAGSVTTERDLVSAITQGIYNNQASGIPISYTTAFR
jgi:hypothetical protein